MHAHIYTVARLKTYVRKCVSMCFNEVFFPWG